MKLFYLILFLLFSCSHQPPSSCLHKKLTLDIGSGTTKYYVANVDVCQKEVKTVLAQNSFPFPFKQSLVTNNHFPMKLQQKFIHKLQQLIHQYQPTRLQAVATSAFRTAANGQSFAKILNKKLQLNLKIITQQEEGLLGYHAVKNIVSTTPLIYWDIGGASMQIIIEQNKKIQIYKGKIGAVSFKNMVLKHVFHNRQKSPNPLRKHYKKAVYLAKQFALHTLPKNFLNTHLPVYGIGGVHQYAILKNNKKDGSFYTVKELHQWLIKKSKLNNHQLGGKYADTDVTNLALVLGFMQALHINQVNVIPNINMAYALLYK